jgi:hypothetical protein
MAGCATKPNLVGPRGNDLNTSYGLQDRRAAKQHVKVASALPAGAQAMGEFSVERCHQYAQNEAPSDAVLTDDLVLLAYAEGADGLVAPRFSRESGLLKNCWTVAKGTATFFKLK